MKDIKSKNIKSNETKKSIQWKGIQWKSIQWNDMQWKKMTACLMTAALFGSTLTACGSGNKEVNNTSAKKDDDKEKSPKSEAASAGVGSGMASKEETVYVVTDKSGKATNITVSEWLKNQGAYESLDDLTNLSDIVNVKGDESFVLSGNELTFAAGGSDIYYQGSMPASEKLPVELKITYTIDGKEVSASDIVGKSGKLVMKIQYVPNEKTEKIINGEKKEIYLPFLAATGMLLSTDKCTNVEITNGKVISNGNYNVVIGIGIPGLGQNLGLEGKDAEKIPDTVEITADVKDFDLDMMMTFVTNEMFSELDFEEADSLSDIDEQIKTLTDASSQLREGIKTLRQGIESLNSGSSTLADGAMQLDEGAKALATGLDTALSGSKQLVSGSSELENGLQKLMSAFTATDGAVSAAEQLDSSAAALSAGISQLAGGLNNTFSQIAASQQEAAKTYSDYLAATGLSDANVESNTEIQQQLTQYIGNYAMRCIAINNEILTTKQEEIKQQKTKEAMAANQKLIAETQQRVIAENQATVTEKVKAEIMEANKDYIDSIKQRIQPQIESQVKSQIPQLQQEIQQQVMQEYLAKYPNQDMSGGIPEELLQEIQQQVMQRVTERVTQMITEQVTQQVTQEVTAAYGKVIEKQVTQELTEMVEAEVTQVLTPEVTQAVTQELTAMVTQAVTNDAVLKEYNEKIAALVQAAGQKGAYTALKTISDGAASQDLTGNLGKLVSGAGELADGVARFRGAIGRGGDTSTETIFGALYNLSQGSGQLYTGMVSLNDGVSQLESGSNTLADGTGSLKAKVPELLSGIEQLLDGSKTLESGMNEFDKDGIQKIADLYNGDIKEFIENIKAVAEAGKEYKTFTKLADNQEGSVKFIITTK